MGHSVPVISEKDFYSRLGKRIRELRTGAGLNQEQLARALPISRTSVTNIEQGRQKPSIYLLVLLSRSLGVELGELLPKTDAKLVETALPQEAESLEANEKEWVRKIAARFAEGDQE